MIYGDSVAEYTPVLIRVGGCTKYATIDSLAEYGGPWKACDAGLALHAGKAACELAGVETWTDAGWTRLHRLIRHELPVDKVMVRVLTSTGMVDVTDDHSLLRADASPVSPNDVLIGDELLHHALPEFETPYACEAAKAGLLGAYLIDGAGAELTGSTVSVQFDAISGSNTWDEWRQLELCRKGWPDIDWVALDDKVVGVGDGAASLFRMLNDDMHKGGRKVVPDSVLAAGAETRWEFWRGMTDSREVTVFMLHRSHITAATVYALAASLGMRVTVTSPDEGCCVLTAVADTHERPRLPPTAVKKICDVPYEGAVYDLTTDNHHFAAGVGTMVVHNTDSIFIEVSGDAAAGGSSIKHAIEYGIAAQEAFKPHLKPPHDCEWEKVFHPFIIFSKKRYIGNVYDNPQRPDKFKMKCMGVVLKRRDNAPIVKTIYGGCIDILLNKHDIGAAVEFLLANLYKLIDDGFPLDQLIVTKSLRASYKDPTRYAAALGARLATSVGTRCGSQFARVRRLTCAFAVLQDRAQGAGGAHRRARPRQQAAGQRPHPVRVRQGRGGEGHEAAAGRAHRDPRLHQAEQPGAGLQVLHQQPAHETGG